MLPFQELQEACTVIFRKEFEMCEGELESRVEDLSYLSEEVKAYLKRRGIQRLFKFQEEAIQRILAGRDVVIVAPTGNGKTEAFTIPIVQRLLEEKARWGSLKAGQQRVRALFVYPTKALARDQLKKFKEIEKLTGVRFEVLDGDTPPSKREKILKDPPEVLITNPDMIHIHLHGRLRDLFTKAEFIVLDEIHEYTGAFGSNVHMILRRLERFTSFQLIGASATISNPKEFGESLFGREVEVVKCERGRRGKTTFVMLMPKGISPITFAARLLKALVERGYKTLAFANTHKAAELICKFSKQLELPVEIHRAGLPANFRRRVEEDFREGKLRCVVATPTLELGIDIGDVDAVVSLMTSFTRMIQRIGRAGRKGQESVAILLLREDDPISNYYAERPEEYFSDIDPAYVEPRNEVVAYYQLLAASLDKPLKGNEFQWSEKTLERLEQSRLLVKAGETWLPSAKARRVVDAHNIRGIGAVIKIREESGRSLGERVMPMAARELHPGAVYMHAGKLYVSKSLVFDRKKGYAIVEEVEDELPYRTSALFYSEPEVVEALERRALYSSETIYSKLRMRQVVYGYLVKDIYSERVFEKVLLEEEISYEFPTMGLAFSLPVPREVIATCLETKQELPSWMDDFVQLASGAFHAAEHVIIEGSDMLTGGGSSELGGIAMGQSGIVFVYDSCPGGSGLAKLLYTKIEEALRRSITILSSCKCERVDGCPACTYSYQCGNNNKPLFKRGALETIRLLLKGEEPDFSVEEYVGYRPYA